MKLNKFVLGLSIVAVSAMWACDDDEDDDNDNRALSAVDKRFVDRASMTNIAEIELGRVAQGQAADSMVRDFAEMTIEEHQDAQAELKSKVQNTSYQFNEDLDSASVNFRTQLQSLSGRSFDSTYLANQVSMHAEAISAFENYQSTGNNAALKDYVNKYLPRIREHREMADSLINTLFSADTTGTDTTTTARRF